MDFENEPIANALELTQNIFLNLFDRKELIPNNWNKSFAYLIGVAIWDVFSNNHKVISKNHKVFSLGSWRVCGDNIAEIIESNIKNEPFYDYMDFYKGSIYQLPKEVELFPIYRGIFEILKHNNCDWRYALPKLHIEEIKNRKLETNNELNTITDKLKKAYINIHEKFEKNPVQILIEAYKHIYNKLPNAVDEE